MKNNQRKNRGVRPVAIDHAARAREAWPLLVCRARNGGKTYTYGGLCAEMGLHHRAAAWFLGVIQNYCEKQKFPALQALVVNSETGLPGNGYHGRPITREAHNRMLKKVYAHKWPYAAPF